jgi:hypothetical protein
MCRDRFRGVSGIGAGTVRFILILAMFLGIWVVSSCEAAGLKLSRDGYAWVPVEENTSRPTDKQKEMLVLLGEPDATWKTPFGTVMWVYCQYGVPVRILIFGEKEMIKEGTPSTDRTDLCKEP